jgi:hypothetical protein
MLVLVCFCDQLVNAVADSPAYRFVKVVELKELAQLDEKVLRAAPRVWPGTSQTELADLQGFARLVGEDSLVTGVASSNDRQSAVTADRGEVELVDGLTVGPFEGQSDVSCWDPLSADVAAETDRDPAAHVLV